MIDDQPPGGLRLAKRGGGRHNAGRSGLRRRGGQPRSEALRLIVDTKAYLAQIWTLVRPYRTRLVLGVLCGFLSGLANPLLMVAVKVATEAVFPQASSGGGSVRSHQRASPRDGRHDGVRGSRGAGVRG